MRERRNITFGVVEGFYGVFYTSPERNDLIRFIARHGYNLYVYAPKNDRQQRARWWEPYPIRLMAQFEETLGVAGQSGVDFCYAISPGGSVCYSSSQDFELITAKLQAFYDLGVRSFSLMLDDNDPHFHHKADEAACSSIAAAQAALANRLLEWLKAQDPDCTLIFVPAEYSGRSPFSNSLVELGALLHPDIDICYTGPETCSPAISTADAQAFADAAHRPPIIWDNYPVNDLSMQPELHLGPVTGRSADLVDAVRGFLVNPMIQAEATRIPLATYARYFANPVEYDPPKALAEALIEVAGADYAAAMQVLADNVTLSCLGCEGKTLDFLAREALESNQQYFPYHSKAVADLEAYLTEIDEATYHLKFRMENLSLRNNILPWIEVLEHWMWMTRFALRVLRAIEKGQTYTGDLNRVYEYREAIRTHPKRIASQGLLPLVEMVLERAEKNYRSSPTLEAR